VEISLTELRQRIYRIVLPRQEWICASRIYYAWPWCYLEVIHSLLSHRSAVKTLLSAEASSHVLGMIRCKNYDYAVLHHETVSLFPTRKFSILELVSYRLFNNKWVIFLSLLNAMALSLIPLSGKAKDY
jgi:hypothetical protein